MTRTRCVPPQTARKTGSDVIIIHPGSRFLRIGRASDDGPRVVHHVIARKCKMPHKEPPHTSCIPPFIRTNPPTKYVDPPPGLPQIPLEYQIACDPDDPVRAFLDFIRSSLPVDLASPGSD